MKRNAPKPRALAVESKCRGSSLLEVMLAVALIAVTSLGLIAGQLWMAREARAMSMREHAAWIADSIAEALYAHSADAALAQWSARASVVLPGGKAALSQSAGTATALVTWTSARNMAPADESNDALEQQRTCAMANVPARASCVALAFSQ